MKRNQLFSGFLLIFLSLLAHFTVFGRSNFSARSGVLKAEPSESGKLSAFPLSGEWEFFFQKFATEISPQDEGQILNVPGDWHEVSDFGPNYTEGFGTYRLRISGLRNGQIYGLKIPTIHSAHRIILDGTLMGGLGEIGRTRDEVVPEVGGQVLYFTAEAAEIILLIEVSNFHYFQSGIWSPIFLGDEMSILRMDRTDRMYSFLLVGALLIMGIYHLFLVFIQKRFKESLFFGAACIFLAVRELAGPDAILLDIWPSLSHSFILRLVFLCLGLAFMFQTLFVFKLFLENKKSWVFKSPIIVTVVFILGILVLDTRTGSVFFNYFTLILAPPFLLFCIYLVIKAVVKKREGAFIFLSGLVFFYTAATYDFIWAFRDAGSGSSNYLLPYGFFFLILSQSVLLAIRFNKAFINEAKLSNRLKLTNESFRRFVPQAFLKLLGKEDIIDVKLGDSISRDMTVLFADVRDFTSLSEGLSSKETFEFINRLLKRTDPIISKNGGFIDKYIGDAVMALFEESPDDALKAAIELQKQIDEANKSSGLNIGLGIGVHFGNLILGTVGSDQRMDGTVISDAVNTASRIEELTKTYNVRILISDDCKIMLNNPDEFKFRKIDEVNLRGRKALTKLYEVIFSESKNQEEFLGLYEKAWSFYRQVNVVPAKELFEKCLDFEPEDGPSKYFLRKIKEYNKARPRQFE
ncbi:adenylate/guanylate cyclase domain-containing protein [Algoriphagus sediminis]|uniref:Adenylate/guanylate cyclase domain-containing protein n=1 Tax=Algoriphagus sediminis TaxID=3057113 RepID=A0ABT7YCL1_9BACT|nr:adenylate/guanylate cyclase domain-containing protein [Algoriphagus sediminis]MDN3204258.1 adenylate/guanylate cyclase domain-containing protein [Algoriphagus sediminis]